MIQISNSSRQAYSTRYRGVSGDYWGTRPPISIPKSGKDAFHRVTDDDVKRIDLLAWRYYGDCALWWVIAEANDIVNPLGLEVSRVLRIPSLETVQMRILR
jgi:nucleoid-associated protein YgaU